MVSATSLEMHAVTMSIVCYNLNLFLFEQNMIKNKIKSRYTQGTRPWVPSSRIAMATSCRKCSITLAAASPPGWPSTRPFWQGWREPDPCMPTTSLPNATRGFWSSRWFFVATTRSRPVSLSLSPPAVTIHLSRSCFTRHQERKKQDRECHGFLLLHAIDGHSPPSYHVRLSSPGTKSIWQVWNTNRRGKNRLLIPDEDVDFEE